LIEQVAPALCISRPMHYLHRSSDVMDFRRHAAGRSQHPFNQCEKSVSEKNDPCHGGGTRDNKARNGQNRGHGNTVSIAAAPLKNVPEHLSACRKLCSRTYFDWRY
jgi:hypothetical protein